jgi:hypothetical protein
MMPGVPHRRSKTRLLVVLVLAATPVSGRARQFPAFPDVAAEAGVTLVNVSGGPSKDYILEVNGNGAAFFDYDDDGDTDLALTNGSTIDALGTGGHPMMALYRNDGGRFLDVTAGAGLDRTGWAMGLCVSDYDNDGRRDLYVTAFGGNVLYRNLGGGRFEDVTETAGVGETRWSSNCAFSDYDRDGDVDLYVANYLDFDMETPRAGESDVCTYLGMDVFCGPRGLLGAPDRLYRNEGDGTFVDATAEAGIGGPGANGFGVVFRDFDVDGWPDIYVANDMMPNLLYHNNRDGTFTEIGLLSGTALNDEGREQAGMGIGAADFDGDGLPDILVTNFSRDTNTLYRNLGEMLFTDATDSAGLGRTSLRHLGWGVGFPDLDNDGWRDIFVANGHVYPRIDELDTGRAYAQPKEVYRNLGNGRFEEVGPDPDGDLAVPHSSRGAAFGDFDDDGDIDILVVNMNEIPSLYRNDGGNMNHWIRFTLEGTESNRDAIGARVEIVSGGRTQTAEVGSGGSYLSHDDMRVHFGLGTADAVESVRIHWPSGRVEEYPGMEADREVRIREGDPIAGPGAD